jgi:hypothetical protein
MAQVNQVVRSGNKIVAKFDNKDIGLLQDVRFTEDYAPTEASGVGNIHVQEWVPTMARYQVATRFMLLNKQSMYNAGIVPEDGDAVLQGLVFDIEVLDRATGKTLRKYIGCSYANGDIEVSKHQIVITSATFNCLQASGTL